MLTEVQLYMSRLCQPGSQVIRAFSDVEMPCLFSDLVVKAAKSENKKGFHRQRRLGAEAAKSEYKKVFQRQRRLGLAAG